MRNKEGLKFYRLYNSFSDIEKTEFNKFIKSPLGNSKRDYCSILSSLASKEQFRKNLSIKNRTKWNRLSELYSMAECFLVYNRVRKNNFTFDKLLLEQYLENNQLKLFRSKFNALFDKVKNECDLLSNNKILSELFFLNSVYYRKLNDRKNYSMNFQNNSEYIIYNSLMSILENGMEISHQNNNGLILKKNMIQPFLSLFNFEKYLLYIKSNFPKFSPYFELYYNLYLAFESNTNLKYYYKAKSIFFNDLSELSKTSRSHIYSILIELCINYRNNDAFENEQELFFLINNKLKEGFDDDLKGNGFILNRFNDYLIVALNMKKISWAKSFIRKYSKNIPADFKNNELNLAYAKLEFHSGNFERSIDHLRKVLKLNVYYYISVSKLSFKINYLNNQYEECYSEIVRLKKYISSHSEIPSAHRIKLNYFLKCFTALLKYRSYPLKKNLKNLEFELSKANKFSDKEWIIEMSKNINSHG